MSTAYTDIRAALAVRLDALNAHPVIAWENIPFKPVIGTPYLKPVLLPAEPSQAELGTDGRNEQRGVYQVSLYFPTGNGTKAIYAMADAICTHFKRGTTLTANGQELRISKAGINPLQQETDWLHLPVSISFYSYTNN